ncbi:MAG TPA: hypothetical protein VFJ47_03585 [Terriglobales bacterium]|nr:hypothetical protein [Terriglobales bacterium]
MNKHVMFVLMLLACIVVVKPVANAQSAKVTVPYDFIAAGRLLHAGTYTVTRQPVGRGSAVLFRNIDNKESALLLPTTFESAISNWTTLRFEQVGDVRILRVIQIPDAIYTFSLESKAERTALKQATALSAGQ